MSQTVNLGHVVGPGVPNGGTAGQILKKNSATNFDTSWVDNTAEITEMSSSDDRTVAQAIGSVEASIAIVVNGDNAPQNLSVGQYIFLKNHSTLPSGGRHVTASISSGSAITSNNTAADADGIANALNSNIAKNVVENNARNSNTESGQIKIVSACGMVSIQLTNVKTVNDTAAGDSVIVGNVPVGYRPPNITWAEGNGASGGVAHRIRISVHTNGDITVFNDGTASTAFYANGQMVYFT